MSALVYRLWIWVSLTLVLLVAGCTRDRAAGSDFAIDLDPTDVSAIATQRAEDAQQQASPKPNITYVVEVGDNLASIAANHYVSVDTIRGLNPQLKSDQLVPGDELLIPDLDPPPETTEVEQELDGDLYFYVVRDGDTVSALAERFGISVRDIEAANPAVILDHIAVGQRLAMPQAGDPSEVKEEVFEGLYHVVQKGEFLGAIAVLYNVESVQIIRLNELVSPDQLAIGQKLKLPEGAILLELATEEPAAGEGLIHVVKEGETLSGIAVKYEVRLSTLVEANNLGNADQLALGQELFVPGVVPVTSESQRIHVVQAGETLLSIAELYLLPLQALQSANNLEDGELLKEGQELIVPEVAG